MADIEGANKQVGIIENDAEYIERELQRWADSADWRTGEPAVSCVYADGLVALIALVHDIFTRSRNVQTILDEYDPFEYYGQHR